MHVSTNNKQTKPYISEVAILEISRPPCWNAQLSAGRTIPYNYKERAEEHTITLNQSRMKLIGDVLWTVLLERAVSVILSTTFISTSTAWIKKTK